jgi:two-component system, sensor histidine kinase and response regulator
VDDNALNREVVSDFLTLAGVEVQTASNGLDALSRLDSGDFEAVLMDVHMPVMDGLTASREIRKREQWAELPIIALTAQARNEDRLASLAAGMNAHLTKPIDEMELYRTLLQLLPPIEETEDPLDHEEAAAVVSERAEPAPPCVDLSAALARLGNNPERLSRLLNGFIRDFSSAPMQVIADYSSGRTEDVAALAHTVKGSAGYLDAHELCESARRLEESARRADGAAMEVQVPVFRQHLETVLEHLNDVISQPVAAATTTTAQVDTLAALKLIAQVEPLVAHGDYAAQTLLDEIVSCLSGTAAAGLAREARAHFEELELDASLHRLRRLQKDLQQSAGGV